MNKIQNSSYYDLEERTLAFARQAKDFVIKLPKNDVNNVYIPQLIRSASSVGANYIEANESLSKKDFLMRIKISRKEAKETVYWLKLVDYTQEEESNRNNLIGEATELMKIFGSIVTKSK